MLLKTSRWPRCWSTPTGGSRGSAPGARWGEVIAAAAPFGLAPLSGTSPTVGVAGYTLGGGVGWLSRRYGFAADSVLRAEVVTADGRRCARPPTATPDLFWAIRGGGGNFGVGHLAGVPALPGRPGSTPAPRRFPIDRAADVLALLPRLGGRACPTS